MAIRHCDVIWATGQERARRVGVAIAGFVARQDISVGCRDCACAGTGRRPGNCCRQGTLRAAEWAGSVECRQLGSSRRRHSVAGQLNADKPHYVN